MPNNTPKNKEPNNNGKKKIPFRGPQGSLIGNLLSTLAILLVLSALYTAFSGRQGKEEEISLSELSRDVSAGQVSEILIDGSDLLVTYKEGQRKEARKEADASLTETLSNYGVPLKDIEGLKIKVKGPSSFSFFLVNILPFLLPVAFIIFLIWYLSRQVKGAGMQALSFGQSKARVIDPNNKSQRVLFKDVAGAKEAKEELLEIVDFLKNPKKFIEIGARIPKGVLLMGAPGTGKTLLARAVAGEAGVPFFSISGSEFVEMFVGVGASRVRDLFKMAKKSAPAIIFIDEIDAVGRVRGTGVGGGNDEREQTLNQILVEMDGFEPNEKVIIMAATNRPDVLDPALLRPGRFDRRVRLDLPDRDDREAILNVHAGKKPLAEDVNLRLIAERTPGFSGADLQSLFNEAAILAARENRKMVSQFDLIRSIEKVMLGPERRSHILTKKEKEVTAYHEGGHALVSSVLPNADPVHKISIISRGHAAGYTLNLPLEEKQMQTRKGFLDRIASALGGYVAERTIFDDLTTGPSNDLQVATALARDMVTKYGMSEHLGPVALEGMGGRALYGKGLDEGEYSEEVSAKIDAEVSKIMTDAHDKAKDIIIKYRPVLDEIARQLIENETLEQEDYEKILIANGIALKKKEDEPVA